MPTMGTIGVEPAAAVTRGRDVGALMRSLDGRPRQVLPLLLSGVPEKQVAAKLGISPNTVHVYVKAVYRHFGASSRPELMSMFLRDALQRGAGEAALELFDVRPPKRM
jgi:DNA-binding NarL/FixJ family response regulator